MRFDYGGVFPMEERERSMSFTCPCRGDCTYPDRSRMQTELGPWRPVGFINSQL